MFKHIFNVNEDNYLNPTKRKNKIKQLPLKKTTIRGLSILMRSSYLGRLSFEFDLHQRAGYETCNISNQDILLRKFMYRVISLFLLHEKVILIKLIKMF